MSSASTLWIIDPSVAHPEDEAVAEILSAWPGAHRVFQPGLVPADGPGPRTGYATDAVVLLGSRASVHDRLPWIERLGAWLSPLLDGTSRVPLLGICFGHQLIAHVAGAPVGFLRPDRAKRVGIEDSQLDGSRLLPGSQSLRVIVSHCEEVKACPRGFRVVARRGPVLVDGLEHGELPVFSFQFHPEAGEEFARHAGIDEALIDERLKCDNRRILDAFRRLALGGGD